MIPATDMQARSLSRIAHQYQDSPRLKSVVSLLATEVEELRDAAISLELIRQIETAEGDGLDIIGEIVGQPRELSGVVPIDFFDLHDGTGGPASEGFGDEADASDGLRFRSVNEPESGSKFLADGEYRPFLRAAVIRGMGDATPEDVIEVIRAVLPDAPAVQMTFAPGAMTATVQRVLSAEEILILNASGGIRGEVPVVPRAIGIALTVAGL